ncbi:hypothetical protein F383_16470 [Gossypium arboreum]|uniref:Uncharacterized protein n=1 Tax=Gossypium arboreum TaxID=29729 RepID=A0A0B0N9L3_GOSAR|nr:hypothetical protein F383_16470 [Gossypium arboreum]
MHISFAHLKYILYLSNQLPYHIPDILARFTFDLNLILPVEPFGIE